MRRLSIALFVVVALAGSAFAQDAGTQKTQVRITRQQLEAIAPGMPLTLTALFAVAADDDVSAGLSLPAELPNIVFARKNDDASISTTCVTDEAAARTFMQQPFRQEPGKP